MGSFGAFGAGIAVPLGLRSRRPAVASPADVVRSSRRNRMRRQMLCCWCAF